MKKITRAITASLLATALVATCPAEGMDWKDKFSWSSGQKSSSMKTFYVNNPLVFVPLAAVGAAAIAYTGYVLLFPSSAVEPQKKKNKARHTQPIENSTTSGNSSFLRTTPNPVPTPVADAVLNNEGDNTATSSGNLTSSPNPLPITEPQDRDPVTRLNFDEEATTALTLVTPQQTDPNTNGNGSEASSSTPTHQPQQKPRPVPSSIAKFGVKLPINNQITPPHTKDDEVTPENSPRDEGKSGYKPSPAKRLSSQSKTQEYESQYHKEIKNFHENVTEAIWKLLDDQENNFNENLAKKLLEILQILQKKTQENDYVFDVSNIGSGRFRLIWTKKDDRQKIIKTEIIRF